VYAHKKPPFATLQSTQATLRHRSSGLGLFALEQRLNRLEQLATLQACGQKELVGNGATVELG
jgi:hypothetical protein